MELHHLGLSVSYHRVLQVENELANSVCQDFKKKGVVCPSQLRKGLFTVAAIDNIDHNPPSNTAKCSFHGTGMFLKVYYEYVHPYEIFLQYCLVQLYVSTFYILVSI